ncbi:metallophosphoesterase [Halosquirtibacter xylanolyticus]|uniref:metallophosphoesterase n=1 Tax=Halosquirtibacter xylanolyticus TaxID=3374599 RepID=UPI0037489BB9|nr:metallophosphoesterase [Prolixibacteraceae bacterium]
MKYDIIGDVHGHASLLKMLLKELGYQENDGVWFHRERKAIYCGDFINRGPEIVETFEIVKRMCEGGHAYAVLGNHEFSLMIWHSFKGKDLMKPNLVKKAGRLCKSTRLAFKEQELSLKEYVKWLRSLPLFLEFDGFRVVHASWSEKAVGIISSLRGDQSWRKSEIREMVLDNGAMMNAVSLLVHGPIMTMPKDIKVYCSRGLNRKVFRLKWWCTPLPDTFREICFEGRYTLPEYTIPKEIMPSVEVYSPSAPAVFCGHYCRADGAQLLSHNIVCVDSCISHSNMLSAYKHSIRASITRDNFVTVSGAGEEH